MAFASSPAKGKTYQLPQRIETKASRHYRVSLEMAVKKPQPRFDIKFRNHKPLAELSTVIVNVYYAVKHQHVRQGQLGVSRTKHFAMAAI
jgi:hypothetical protein